MCATGRLLALAAAVLLLAGCAGTQNRHTDPERDPWEGYNRKVHAFNMGFDRALLRPVARGYDAITPDPVQRGIGNFFRNLNYPVTGINLLLQGKFGAFADSTGRFLANTIFGLGGFFDVASRSGIPEYDEDLGQTFATWGWEESRYFELPFLGPRTVRDTLGFSFFGYFNPVAVVAREEGIYWPAAVDLIQIRASLLPQDQAMREAYDPYAFVRDAWLQRRDYLIYDGNPPAPDYDAYLEELDE